MTIQAKNKQQSATKKPSRGEAFVDYVIRRCSDTGVKSALKRADNPDTEYQSWSILADFGVDLEHENKRLPFAVIAAAIARSNAMNNGHVRIGAAIARCYSDGRDSDQARAKLRRLLACDAVDEACRVLRPLFSLIERNGISLDYAALLNDLLWFNNEDSHDRITARWAQDFYGRKANGDENE